MAIQNGARDRKMMITKGWEGKHHCTVESATKPGTQEEADFCFEQTADLEPEVPDKIWGCQANFYFPIDYYKNE